MDDGQAEQLGKDFRSLAHAVFAKSGSIEVVSCVQFCGLPKGPRESEEPDSKVHLKGFLCSTGTFSLESH
jgi:hypothetical protein